MCSSLITVVVRTINRNHLLTRALDSLKLQTYSNLEVVIVNDGGASLEETLSTNYSELNYQLIEFPKNQGRSAAANCGIRQASGDCLVFLDDDDLLYPNHLEDLFAALGSDSIAYCDALNRVEKIEGTHCKFISKQLLRSETHSLKRMLEGNFIPINCLIFKRLVFTDELFDESLDVLEDWDLWIRLSEKYSFKHLAKIRAEYSTRTKSTGASDNTTGNNLEVWQQTGKLIKQRYQKLWQAEGLKTIPTK